ncbi:MAG: hypothetical protein OHK0029_21340 [Armatimonadaceae bacterium]
MDWQQIISLILVAMAAVYVARQLWRQMSAGEDGGCGGCNGCGKPSPMTRPAPKAVPLITLGSPPPRKK